MEIASVIKYEGDNTTLIWKHPTEDFNAKSQLIVHESQEAIFFMNGQALDTFGPGRHTLETDNLPLIRNFYHLVTGGENPFHCEVYFINKTAQLAVKWGTDSKVQYLEPQYGFPLEIGACGELCVSVENGRKLLLKLVGTQDGFTHETMTKAFRAILMNKIKPYLVNTIRQGAISIFEIDGYIDQLSAQLHEQLRPDFAEYGLSLDKFFLTSILKPEDDKTYQKFKELYFRNYADVAEAQLRQKVSVIDQTTEAQKRVIDAQSMAQKRQIEGYTYQDERSFDVAERIAQNEGVGNFSSTGIGLGLMTGIGGAVGNTTANVFAAMGSGAAGAPVVEAVAATGGAERFCPQCGAKNPQTSRFCNMCGTPLQQAAPSKCPACGAELGDNDRFCPQCGAKRG